MLEGSVADLIQAPSGPMLVEGWRRRSPPRVQGSSDIDGIALVWHFQNLVIESEGGHAGTRIGNGVTTSVVRTEWSPADVDQVSLATWKRKEERLTRLRGVGVGELEGLMAWALWIWRWPSRR